MTKGILNFFLLHVQPLLTNASFTGVECFQKFFTSAVAADYKIAKDNTIINIAAAVSVNFGSSKLFVICAITNSLVACLM